MSIGPLVSVAKHALNSPPSNSISFGPVCLVCQLCVTAVSDAGAGVAAAAAAAQCAHCITQSSRSHAVEVFACVERCC